MTDSTIVSKELSLHEMLADPIVQTVMARDGVTAQQVKSIVGAVQHRLAGRQLQDNGPHRQDGGRYDG